MSGRIQTVSGPCDRNAFVGVGHMAFNTDIMQEVYPPDVVPESSISHFSLIVYITSLMMKIQ